MEKSISLKKHPKFQLGETVWVMTDNKPYSFIVGLSWLYNDEFYYNISPKNHGAAVGGSYEESLCFPSKEELIKSL